MFRIEEDVRIFGEIVWLKEVRIEIIFFIYQRELYIFFKSIFVLIYFDLIIEGKEY